MVDPVADAVAPKEKPKKTKTVQKTVTKKTSAPKKVVVPKASKPKSSAASVKKVLKGKIAKAAAANPSAVKKVTKKKPKASKAAPESTSEFSKFEAFALEAISAEANEEKPYVSVAKIKKYILDYSDKGQPKQVTRFVKQALVSLTVKKILKVKKDSYALTAFGKSKAPAKVPNRKKVVRATKTAPAPKKVAPAKPTITLSGRASRPVALPA
jgi:hypothetical protein